MKIKSFVIDLDKKTIDANGFEGDNYEKFTFKGTLKLNGYVDMIKTKEVGDGRPVYYFGYLLYDK
jgi:hypothetical protein